MADQQANLQVRITRVFFASVEWKKQILAQFHRQGLD